MARQLRRGTIYEQGYFDRAAVQRLLAEHQTAGADHSDQLWPLLSLGMWADRFHGLEDC